MGSFVPNHLKKYIVPQNYKKYSSQDQAVWRYIMKGINYNLSLYGYEGCLEGIQKTGIQRDKIPKISNIDKKLQKFGWRAACISGFIPPRAFMEFQMNKILPIASEIRAIEHIFYTPAPDIVHEAVGHIPFLTNPIYSKFLEKYAQTVLKAITSRDDIEIYKAIRDLSDLKEDSSSTDQQIKKQEEKLKKLINRVSYRSEASYLSSFIWWTSEYGLMGSVKQPKVYGAGLISSLGEISKINSVKKIKLDEKCLKYPFDITDYQPQLFVAQNFSHLLKVLEKISSQLAFRKAGLYGVDQAIKSRTVNTVVLDSGLQISGVVEKVIKTKNNGLAFLKFSGPTQLSFENKQLKGHGTNYHKEGYSTPLAYITENRKAFHLWNSKDLTKANLEKGKEVKMLFEGGISLKAELHKILRVKDRLLVLSFKNCSIKDKNYKVLYQPSWGPFDLAIGNLVTSVFSGAADIKNYKQNDKFKPAKIPVKRVTKKQEETFKLYKQIANLKEVSPQKLNKLLTLAEKQDTFWLILLELLDCVKSKVQLKKQILDFLKQTKHRNLKNHKAFNQGRIFYNV